MDSKADPPVRQKINSEVKKEDAVNTSPDITDIFGSNFKIITPNNQIKELQTIIRDKNTTRSDFRFVADRLIRLVLEEGLNQLPYSTTEVVTPTGATYQGLKFEKGNCGVSIVRSGEAMEHALRDCCRSMRIGKILIETDMETNHAKVIYAKFPEDIENRKIMLLYPIMSSGKKVIRAIEVLKGFITYQNNYF